MRILYLDCQMGAAGDMLAASLLELFDDKEKIVSELNSLGIEGVTYKIKSDVKCGIVGTHLDVLVDGVSEDEHMHDHHHEHGHEHEHHHTHSHTSLHDIEHIVNGHLKLSDKVKADVMAVYECIAEAEGHVHGKKMDEIHFHEVGTMDAVADISAVCYLLDKLNVDTIIASPINVGSGQVKCAHGILPVPAPATAHILSGVPMYQGSIKSELCTPTGAALLKHFVTRFDNMPAMITDRIGYGMGKKDFEAANCVRAVLGQSAGETADEMVSELSFNVDDMTGEMIGFLMQKLFDAGALEVYSEAIGMKKNRPGIKICVLCNEDTKDAIIEAIFKHSTTIGIRQTQYKRYTLDRNVEKVMTPLGIVRVKTSSGYGVTRKKYEYEDIATIANRNGMSIDEVVAILDK